MFTRSTGHRSCAPSNPTSPGSQQSPTALHGSVGSPPGAVGSRLHSWAQSQSQSTFSHISPLQLDLTNTMYEAFDDTVTKLPMQCMSADSDSDDSEDDSVLGLVFDHSTASSTASMEPLERLDALQWTNADLAKKLVDTAAGVASLEPRSSTSGMCSSTFLSSEREHQGMQLHSAHSIGSQGSQQ